MLNVNKFKALLVERGKTQAEIAKELGITENTMTRKIQKGIFLSDEISLMIDILEIENPMEIFFLQIKLTAR